MPEFEDEHPNAPQSQSYTPSTDASKKPRTRRRSGGFKTEVASTSTANIGEVSAADALKQEKLSGSGKPADAAPKRSEKPARKERSERKPREPREPKAEREPREPKAARAPREKREPRRETNPQPSPETLAAIASVEAKIAERKTERDARRAERDKNKPKKAENQAQTKSAPKKQNKPAAKKKQGGLIAAIAGFFGKLFGSEPEPTPKKGGGQNRGRGGRPQGKGGNRGGQNRGRGGSGSNGGGRGQGRKRGGKGPRNSDRRTNENVGS